MQNTGKIYIGTSGFHYKHWIGRFYPEGTKTKDFFTLYLERFSTLELNNSFYRLPSLETFDNWRKTTPTNFIFSVKANKFITHNKKLKDGQETFSNFIRNAEGLREKLGPILFQLPPGWGYNEERFRDFLKVLPKNAFRYTFEFRNTSWHNQRVYDLLEEKNIAFCIYELEYHLTPLKVTADFVYIRLHGPEGKYAGNYPDKTLAKWAEECISWAQGGKDVFVYFDNDQNAYAAFNALKLLELTTLEKVPVVFSF